MEDSKEKEELREGERQKRLQVDKVRSCPSNAVNFLHVFFTHAEQSIMSCTSPDNMKQLKRMQ